MAIFSRRNPPPQDKHNYSEYRPFVREDFRECCAYCLICELLAGGEENFELDHFRPKSLPEFVDLKGDFLNLYYSCHPCNHLKGASWPSPNIAAKGYRFIDPCKELFSEHFRPDKDGRWQPLSPAGQYTEEKLRLNRFHLVKLRQLLNEIAALQGIRFINWDRSGRKVFEEILGGDGEKFSRGK